MENFLGGANEAGGKLKETGTTHWNSPNSGATNETGFSALPGGHRNDNETISYIRSYVHWWSTTQGSTNNALDRYMGFDYSDLRKGN